MNTERIKAQVLALPEVAAWPAMAGVFERAVDKPRPDWDLPVLACQAVGGEPSLAIPGAAAIACMQVSIILVDDMLDQDPRGEHLRSGIGPTANLALAFQAAGFGVLERANVDAVRRAAATASLAWLALATARGQDLDVQNLKGEENYWKVVRAKSTPFYGAALHIGALLGGAEPEIAAVLRDFGVLIGEIIQISDDLVDAFVTPANPDWRQGRNNLPILYARTAEHPDRQRFLALLPRIESDQALRQAQDILIKSGAVSYCAYHMIGRQRESRRLLEGVRFADPEPMLHLLAQQAQPVIKLLQAGGSEIPAELLVESQT